ncbi:Uncharacterized protein dnl_55490 [Desulfonema limicola]|uniref:Uncharacterized protein n=1 Tax=Desulfonema limicola TaxID=45656 RepID=A0A975BDF0_9BACT|nr:Uncharacterized protein dnl_55490 [Desulfonema limicola]
MPAQRIVTNPRIPLRTGLVSFPAYGSSLSKTPFGIRLFNF